MKTIRNVAESRAKKVLLDHGHREEAQTSSPFDLRAGDVISYSAGSTQTGPLGFRKIRLSSPGGHQPGAIDRMLATALEHWPELERDLHPGPVLFINAYPATVGTYSEGISVDTYLSPRVLVRALALGRAAGLPTILLGQPLFVADALQRIVANGGPLPGRMMLWVGGYALPATLEKTLRSGLVPHVDRLRVVQYFGAAEVDAGCLVARDRTDGGELIYFPRRDVEARVADGRLLLGLRRGQGSDIKDFPTGDLARSEGDGWVIQNPKRFHPDIESAFGTWTGDSWRRRTGYVRRQEDGLWIQLRMGEDPREAHELEFFEFARRFGFSWLDKPFWR